MFKGLNRAGSGKIGNFRRNTILSIGFVCCFVGSTVPVMSSPASTGQISREAVEGYILKNYEVGKNQKFFNDSKTEFKFPGGAPNNEILFIINSASFFLPYLSNIERSKPKERNTIQIILEKDVLRGLSTGKYGFRIAGANKFNGKCYIDGLVKSPNAQFIQVGIIAVDPKWGNEILYTCVYNGLLAFYGVLSRYDKYVQGRWSQSAELSGRLDMLVELLSANILTSCRVENPVNSTKQKACVQARISKLIN